MQFIAEPGIILDVLGYNMMFFNQATFKFREKMFSKSPKSALYYYDQLRAGKQKFEPYAQWYPLFLRKQSSANYYPFFKYFWDNFDYNASMDTFVQSLKTDAFKRCCFEHTLSNYSSDVNVENVLLGDLSECLRAAAFLAKDGEDVIDFVQYLTRFEDLIEEIIPYLLSLHRRMKTFHARHVSALLTNLESVFSESETDVRLMHNVGNEISLSEQSYTVCFMEHLVLSCKKLGDNKLFFFTGASGKDSLKLWEETFGINLLSFGSELGNDTKYDIVQTLRKGERTISQIAKLLYTSRSTVERGVVALQRAHVLSVAKHIGVETYYKINPNYFIAAKAKLQKDIDDILNDIMYGVKLV